MKLTKLIPAIMILLVIPNMSLAYMLTTAPAITQSNIVSTKVNPANGHTYYMITGVMYYDDAEAFAQTLGGHLATVNNQAEQDWIVSNGGAGNGFGDYIDASIRGVQNRYMVLIGMWQDHATRDTAVEPAGGFTWISGESSTYTNWGGTNPDNWVGGPGFNTTVYNAGAPDMHTFKDGQIGLPPAGEEVAAMMFMTTSSPRGDWGDINDNWGEATWYLYGKNTGALIHALIEVPEPTTLSLLVLGGLALCYRRR